MGWRYRKSFKLFPGVRINVGAKGISTTIGVRGASINFSNRGIYVNTGIPGTGISYRQRIDTPVTQPPTITTNYTPPTPESSDINYYTLKDLDLPGAIKSVSTDTLTSNGLQDIRALLHAAMNERIAIENELKQTQLSLEELRNQLSLIKARFLASFLYKKKMSQLSITIKDQEDHISELEQQQQLCNIPVDQELDSRVAEAFDNLSKSFIALATCKAIWDITSVLSNDPRISRSSATTVVTRTRVDFTTQDSNIVLSERKPCHLKNANGGDIFLYPGFVLVFESNSKFALIDWKDIDFNFYYANFIEDEPVLGDTKQVGETWRYVNKNGMPDRRFSDNRILPIVEYGDIYITTNGGLSEAYKFSNPQKAEEFHKSVTEYKCLFT